MEVAGHRLDPRVCNRDDRPRQCLFVVADSSEERARGSAPWALRERAATVLQVEAAVPRGRLGRVLGAGQHERSAAGPGGLAVEALAEARSFPLAEPPEVAPHLLGSKLATGEVHVRFLEQPPLVTRER